MLDWLNSKAALSICTVVLIATTGLYLDHQLDRLTINEFESMLDNFVSFIDQLSTSPVKTTVQISSSNDGADDNEFYIMPLFENKPYRIIITSETCVFEQDNLRCSKRFSVPVELISDPGMMNELLNKDFEYIITRDELDGTVVLSFDSDSSFYATKTLMKQVGFVESVVIIGPLVVDGDSV